MSRFAGQCLPRSSYFLSSEFALGKLKSFEELAAIATYWNRHWEMLRRVANAAQGEDKELALEAADQAAVQAWRIEALIVARRGLEGSLLDRFRQERDRREAQCRFVEAA